MVAASLNPWERGQPWQPFISSLLSLSTSTSPTSGAKDYDEENESKELDTAVEQDLANVTDRSHCSTNASIDQSNHQLYI